MGVLLALAASASWAVSDFLGGVNARRVPLATVLLVSQPAGLVLLAVLALAGIVLASREPTPEAGRSRIAAGAVLGLVAAGGFGCGLLGLDAASSRDAYWAPVALRLATTVLVFAVIAARRPLPAVPPRALPPLVALGLFDGAGTCCFAVASTHDLVSVVSVLASLYPIGIIVLARIFLGERLQPVQQAGAAAAVAGAALISAG